MCKNNRKQPIRRCIACNEMKEKQEMLRVVKFRDEEGKNTFTVDNTKKVNGRGAYMCKNLECLAKATKSRGLERSFKMSIPQEAYQAMEEEMTGSEK